MSVSWGSPVTGDYSQLSEDEVPEVGGFYEARIPLTFEPREPTARELYGAVAQYVRKWEAEHPDMKTTYIEVSRSSPHLLRVQFTPLHASPLPPLAVIIGWVIGIFILVCAIVLVGIAVTAGVAIIYGIAKAAPVIGKAFVYMLIGFAALAGFFLTYRFVIKPALAKRKPPPPAPPTAR